MKKIFIPLFIALFVVFSYHIGLVDFLENIITEYKTTKIKDCTISEGTKTIKLGMTKEEIDSLFGQPVDSLCSEYGFTWNIYHNNFKNYIQIGILDGRVVGIYTNSPDFNFYGFCVGAEKESIHNALGKPTDGIVKGTTRYISNSAKGGADFEIYKTHGAYVTLFYETYVNNSLTSINIIDYDVEQDFNMLYAKGSDELKNSFQKQNFYVTNAIRVRHGLSPFKYSDELGKLSFLHSCDMAKNNYFSHYDLNGDSVLERAVNQSISFRRIGENLAMGAQNSLYLHELLMNSDGHRNNILGDFSHMGTGIAFDHNNTPYLTQSFLK